VAKLTVCAGPWDEVSILKRGTGADEGSYLFRLHRLQNNGSGLKEKKSTTRKAGYASDGAVGPLKKKEGGD